MPVPFVDLRAQHDEVRAEIDAAIKEIIDNSSFIGGPRVASFERNFASFCGTRHALACASGTDALRLALMAAAVGPGEEIITPPHTFIATVEAMTMVGAHPAFVDIDGPTYNLSAERLAAFLEDHCRLGRDGHLINGQTGRRVVAVMPVHLYGLPADMAPILDLARQYNLRVIEDACQAHGATYEMNGTAHRAGSIGEVAAFSFYPGKNLGAMGEAGAATTNDAQIDANMRVWHDHGQSQRYIHVSPDGWNGRLDTIQCSVLDIKLKKLDEWNARRRMAAGWYRERLAGDERVVLPVEPDGRQHVYHLFVVRLPDREKVRELLSAGGIGVGLHYPIPLHLQVAYRDLGYGPGAFPESEAAASSILSLPMFPHITEEQVDAVCFALKDALG